MCSSSSSVVLEAALSSFVRVLAPFHLPVIGRRLLETALSGPADALLAASIWQVTQPLHSFAMYLKSHVGHHTTQQRSRAMRELGAAKRLSNALFV